MKVEAKPDRGRTGRASLGEESAECSVGRYTGLGEGDTFVSCRKKLGGVGGWSEENIGVDVCGGGFSGRTGVVSLCSGGLYARTRGGNGAEIIGTAAGIERDCLCRRSLSRSLCFFSAERMAEWGRIISEDTVPRAVHSTSMIMRGRLFETRKSTARRKPYAKT